MRSAAIIMLKEGKPMRENKPAFLRALTPVIQMTRAGEDVESIGYETSATGEYAVLHFKSGYTKKADITFDSLIAVMVDVAKALM